MLEKKLSGTICENKNMIMSNKTFKDNVLKSKFSANHTSYVL